jgi:hypothetical protein
MTAPGRRPRAAVAAEADSCDTLITNP